MPIEFFGQEKASTYHQRYDYWSKSMLATFRERRRLAESRYIKKESATDKTTAVMSLGDLAHAALLEPERLATDYAVIPDELLSGENRSISSKDAKQWVYNRKLEGKVVLKEKDFATVESMVASVKSHPLIGNWLKLPSLREYAIYWHNSDTGLPCRCRPDWIIDTDDVAFGLDVKTTNDAAPEAFGYKAEDFTYWLQSSHYREGIEQAIIKPCEFYFLVVETEPPYACQVSKMDEEQDEMCRRARLRLLHEVVECLQTGNWAERWEHKINTINCRPWKILPL